MKDEDKRIRTFKFKSPEWFDEVVVTIRVTERGTGYITLVVHDPKKLIQYIDHQTDEEMM